MADQKNEKENYDDLIFDWGSFDKYVPASRTERSRKEDKSGEDPVKYGRENWTEEELSLSLDEEKAQTESGEVPEKEEPVVPDRPVLKRGSILNTTEKVSIINLADLLAELKGKEPLPEEEAAAGTGSAEGAEGAEPEKARKEYTTEELLALDDTDSQDRYSYEPEPAEEYRYEARPETRDRKVDESESGPVERDEEEPVSEHPESHKREPASDRPAASSVLDTAGALIGQLRQNAKESGGFSGWLRKMGLSESEEEEEEEEESFDSVKTEKKTDSESRRTDRTAREEMDILEVTSDRETEETFREPERERVRETETVRGAETIRDTEKERDSEDPEEEDISPELQNELSHVFHKLKSVIRRDAPEEEDIDDSKPTRIEVLDDDDEDEEELSGAGAGEARSYTKYGEGHAPEAQKEAPDIIQILTLGVLIAIAVMCIVDLFGILTRGLGGGGSESAEVVTETRPQILIDQENIDESIQQAYLTVNPFSRPAVALDSVRGIVIHDAGLPGKTAMEVRDYYESLAQTQSERSSCHYVVGMDGEIVACVPDNEIAYASNARNMDTISVAFCSADESGTYSDVTYQSLVHLCAKLCKTYQINGVDILRHYDINSQDCPKVFVADDGAWMNFRAAVTAVAAGESLPAEEMTESSEETAEPSTSDETV